MAVTTPVLAAANDETAPFNLTLSGAAIDLGLIQIDSGNAVPGATGTAKLQVKLDLDAQWVDEPTGAFALTAGTTAIWRGPKYPYAKVVLLTTTDALMLHTVYFR